ncbi:MAG: bifunctional methylenetetrahydrofolate dehydrogenase/methenyltetrahydrofolate cyclohydrolase FolD [Clostridia bacterium]|nr:bifunctional methylenetetrahydrofolate dehydrogenase/methenyltetrahydrofolate cyclohydrolase FolD [Clostridia bacterium]
MATIIDGKAVSLAIKDQLKKDIAEYKTSTGKDISLAVVLIGDDPASKVYVNNKATACEYVGITSYTYRLPQETTQEQAEDLVSSLVNDEKITGILVQLPFPKHLDENKILKLIPANKDVDGFSDENIGKLLQGKKTVVSCTPFGVMELLKHYNYDLTGKNAVVIGRSNIVGKPMTALLINANATVTVCHSKTKNLAEIARTADVLIVAIGRPKFVTEDMVKDGAVVIDVGINRVDGKLVGDVDFDTVSKKASMITPVPGGVGPMTIAMLMKNTFIAGTER